MGSANKLLLQREGRPLVARVARAAIGAGLEPLVVVTGYEAERVEGALKGLPIHITRNPRHDEGMGSSLSCGARALLERKDGLLGVAILLGDLAYLEPPDIRITLDAFRDDSGARVVFPEQDGRRGHPVVFPASCLPELAKLRGDSGAKALAKRLGARPVRSPRFGKKAFLDWDVPTDIEPQD